MGKVIYQTNGFRIVHAILIGLLHFLFIVVAVFDDSKTDYPSVLFFLILIWLFIITSFKKFTLTENEFIVEYSLTAFILEPKGIPLDDIQKLVFKQVRGQSAPFIEIYRTSKGEIARFHYFTSREPKRYFFLHNYDDMKKLINALRAKGVQVECIGPVWK